MLAVISFGVLSQNNIAQAAISSGSVSCHTSADCIASTNSPSYDISFTTNNSSTASVIYLAFPSGYTFGAFVPDVFAPDGTPGAISVNGINVTGVSTNRTLPRTLNFYPTVPLDLSVGVVAFTTGGITLTNPSAGGVTGDFAITTNAAGEVAQSNISGVTILATTPPTLSAPISS